MLIKNSRVFINGELKEKEIRTEDGKIKEIGNRLNGDGEEFDGKGLILIPGLIDVHVHLREPGDTYKEDFVSGSKAAIAGGFTTVMDMPNNRIPTITAKRLKEKIELAKKAFCDVYFHFGATENNFEEVKKAKPDSLKIYMGKSTGNLLVESEIVLKRHFENFDKDKPIVLHAEDQGHINKTGKRNEKSALLAVEKAVNLASEVKRKIHIAHATTAEEVKILKKWKMGTIEVTPHNLFLSEKDADKLGRLSGVNPPLRSETSRNELWKVLNQVDCIASDHAPHTIEDKEGGAKGFPGLETSLALMLDAYNRKLIGFADLINKMSVNPARIFNLQNVGEIKIWYKGDFALIDVRKEWVVKGEEQFTKCKWTPFEGRKLKGKVISVIRNGKLIYDEGELQVCF